MASQGQQFPPQKQAAQPGKEHHPMESRSHFTKPDYKPSNKLHGMVALVTGGDSGLGEPFVTLLQWRVRPRLVILRIHCPYPRIQGLKKVVDEMVKIEPHREEGELEFMTSLPNY
ncbi:uncharacterized protein LOC119987976 [Tripterygium wilfordii]|uniref:uncharacterized protein LOC119987976 n=1 Tax=Tripterygium wilfordii TaxID=458696 RepID=UPI0018F86300|nr:uncharacterized protein LOC119987976 [Tripterygium wilfordii]